jgi:hypothetical protein
MNDEKTSAELEVTPEMIEAGAAALPHDNALCWRGLLGGRNL